MPGHKLYPQFGGKVRDGLTCFYCKLVLNDPVQTSESGLRFCKECFNKARRDPNFANELDPSDEVWSDYAAKRDIDHLKVKCVNHMVGCDWTGLFKDLMKHVGDCKIVTVECKGSECAKLTVFPQDDKEIPQRFFCTYCKNVMKDPVQTTGTTQHFCKECFDYFRRESRDKQGLDEEDDEAQTDVKLKSEIDGFKVKCENCASGCEWKGEHKELTIHLKSCDHHYRNPGCGERVFPSDLEQHLKEKCLHRQVECKDCGKKMSFVELQEHSKQCPNAPKVCKNCRKKIPASQYTHHVSNDCKVVKCVCKEEDAVFEVDSHQFYHHLKDTSKLADHLAPMVTEFSKMSMAFQEMAAAYQLSVRRIGELENKVEELEIRNNSLERNSHQSNEKEAILENRSGKYVREIDNLCGKVEADEKHIETMKKQIAQLTERNAQMQEETFSAVARNNDQLEAQVNTIGQQIQQFQQRVVMLEKNWATIREEATSATTSNSRNFSQIMKQLESLQQQQQQTVPIRQRSVFVSSDFEDSVRLEYCYNALSVRVSELELQLQASLASTHNGTFLWRIPKVHQRFRDAKSGRITSIYSPPFCTGTSGYKMCIRAYLNGDGSGEGTHLSIFFVLMRGEYDPLLQWPFKSKVSLILVDQDHKKHLVQTFKPDPQSSSFKRPVSDMNVASGCPEFAELSILDNPSYVKEDVMYIKAIVDTSGIHHP